MSVSVGFTPAGGEGDGLPVAIASTQQIVVVCTADAGVVDGCTIACTLDGQTELVCCTQTSTVVKGARYAGTTVVGANQAVLTCTIIRTGGWQGTSLLVRALATAWDGRMVSRVSTFRTYTSSWPALAAGNWGPGEGTAITPDTAIDFDLTCGATPDALQIIATLEGRPDEVVYRAGQFGTTYQAWSRVHAYAGGLHFSVRRTGGWPASPGLVVLAALAGELLDA